MYNMPSKHNNNICQELCFLDDINFVFLLVGNPVTLTSPNIGGAKNCTLRFFWNMFGVDVGELKVKVKKKNPLHNHFGGWSDSGTGCVVCVFVLDYTRLKS